RTVTAFHYWGVLIALLVAMALACQVLDVYYFTGPRRYFTTLYLSFIVFACAFYVMRQSVLMQDNFRSTAYDQLGSHELDQAFRQIRTAMQAEERYAQSDFSLGQLARLLPMPANKISHILGQRGSSFRQLLNELRIEKARQLLSSEMATQLSLEGIGRQVGYRSKTTFYKHFRENTGLTPRAFLDAQSNPSKSA
ncbi:MAG: helix-turn-helix domain-containing protein, partial [Bacteroidota bacterium]